MAEVNSVEYEWEKKYLFFFFRFQSSQLFSGYFDQIFIIVNNFFILLSCFASNVDFKFLIGGIPFYAERKSTLT